MPRKIVSCLECEFIRGLQSYAGKYDPKLAWEHICLLSCSGRYSYTGQVELVNFELCEDRNRVALCADFKQNCDSSYNDSKSYKYRRINHLDTDEIPEERIV